jgi:hypothetical protein
MTRIVPPITNSAKANHGVPEWLNTAEIIKAAYHETQKSHNLASKLSSTSLNKNIVSYACGACSKVFTVDNTNLKAQANLAINSGKTVEYTCPKCGNFLHPYGTITAGINLDPNVVYANQTEKKVNLQSTSSETYNTFADMHFVLKAVQELSSFASKNGMLMARARYLKGKHIKQAGQAYPVLNDLECELTWVYGRNQKARVTASIGYDIAGKFIYPKVFATPDGQQHPFEKEAIAELERVPHFTQVMRAPKKTDIPSFRRPDITRFRAFAAMEEDCDIEQYKADNADKLKEGYDKHVAKKTKKGKEPNNFDAWAEKQYAKESSLKTAYQQPIPTSQTPTQPQPNQTYQTGQQVVNPADGQTYNVKTPSSGTGMVVTNPGTGQDAMIPQEQIQNVKPAVKTQAQASFKFAEEMSDDLLKQYLKENIEEEGDEIQQHMEMAEGDASEIQKAKNILEQSGEATDYDLGSESDDDASLVEKLLGDEPMVHSDEHDELLTDGSHANTTGYFSEASKKKVNLEKTATLRVSNMASNWNKIRESIAIQQKEDKNSSIDTPISIDKMNRQQRFASDLGYSPDSTAVGTTGHSKVNNVPFAEKKDIEVGLTEFPYDHKQADSVGYNENKGYGIPFAEMDENFLEDREHFNNENKLPVRMMERENLNNYGKGAKKDQNYGYSTVAPTEQEETKFALMEALGIDKFAEDITPSPVPGSDDPIIKPVQHKVLKTAPKVEGFNEAEVIPPASGKISEAITKFQNTSKELDLVKKELDLKTKPLKDSVKDMSKPYEDDIKAKQALLLSYMNMIYDQLSKSDKNIAHYEKIIFAAYQRSVLAVPNVTIAQVIAKAEATDAKLAEDLKKLKAVLENEFTTETLERTLYQYPVSNVQEKKISKLYRKSDLLDATSRKLLELIHSLEAINTEFSDILAEVE